MRPKRYFAGLAVLIALSGLSIAAAVPAQASDETALIQKIDAVMAETYKPGQPGAAILLTRNGRTLLRKGYGLADLELGVPVEPDMIFRLGSITKQFTAVSILLLAQQGKLALGDEITKFLPAYPTQGHKITVESLLTHTSGIQSYTDLPEWLPLWRKDFAVTELVDLFKDKPMRFEPGRRWAYNNSGYFLLGAVIEKASGLSYEEFLDRNIFKPLGMGHSCYGNTERVIPRRIPGYQEGKGGFINAPYLSMTQPYAAGSLLSNVDDLAAWIEAVFSHRVVKKEWLDKALTPFRLTNGESTGYGYGWFISDFAGHRSIEHGGGINGFTSYEMYFPEDRIFLGILTNSAASGREPEPRAVKIARLMLGLPEPERKEIKLSEAELRPLGAVYEDEDKAGLYITVEGGKTYFQRAGSSRRELHAASSLEFFFTDRPPRVLFVRDSKGGVSGLRIQDRIGPAQVFTRTSKPFPAAKKAVPVDPAVFDLLLGDYELAPGFVITVLKRGDKLISQATAQPEVELLPSSETKFFLNEAEAEVEFIKDASGKVTGLTLDQGGQKIPAKKIR